MNDEKGESEVVPSDTPTKSSLEAGVELIEDELSEVTGGSGKGPHKTIIDKGP